jgi:hypothetical protein
MGIVFFGWFSIFSQMFGHIDPNTFDPNTFSPDFDPSVFGYFFLMFPLMMCFGLAQFILMIFYVIHIIKNRAGSEVIRILTSIGFYFLPYIAMPAYFLIYIAPSKTPDWALETTKPAVRSRSK